MTSAPHYRRQKLVTAKKAMTNGIKSEFTSHCRIVSKTNLVLLLFPACLAHARYSSLMIDRFLNWGDHGKPKSGKINGPTPPFPHVILEKNNLQTAQGWTKSYIELVASYVHPKTNNWQSPSITLSQLRAIMDLDRSPSINWAWKKKNIRPNFLRSTSLLHKISPTNLGACKPTFYTIYTSHLRWNSTMRHCFLSYRPWKECSISQFCSTNCTPCSIFRRSKHAWALAKLLKQ